MQIAWLWSSVYTRQVTCDSVRYWWRGNCHDSGTTGRLWRWAGPAQQDNTPNHGFLRNGRISKRYFRSSEEMAAGQVLQARRKVRQSQTCRRGSWLQTLYSGSNARCWPRSWVQECLHRVRELQTGSYSCPSHSSFAGFDAEQEGTISGSCLLESVVLVRPEQICISLWTTVSISGRNDCINSNSRTTRCDKVFRLASILIVIPMENSGKKPQS